MPVDGSHGGGQQLGSSDAQPHDIGSIMHGSLQVDGSFGSPHAGGHEPSGAGFGQPDMQLGSDGSLHGTG